jgi:flagellar hook-length control protein FliK
VSSKTDASSATNTANQNTAAASAPQTQIQPQDSGFAKLLPAASSLQNTSATDQVLVQIKSAASTGASTIRIQLDPADLGKVTVQMNTGTDGKTGITITADNRQTLSMLQNEARSLESALRDIGLKTDTGGLNFNLSGQHSNPQQNSGKQANYTQVAAATTADDADYYSTATAVYQVAAEQGLDIRV